MHSAIYTGTVRHRRYKPKKHEFRYPVYMVWLDLDELDRVFSQSVFWSMEKPAFVQWKRRDFFGRYDKPLKHAVLDWVYEQTGKRVIGPVRMLANLRVAGFLMNPIVCYYCYSQANDGEPARLEYVVTEVTNTPWGERTHYLLSCQELTDNKDRLARGRFFKNMHVSPFHPMDMRYEWRLDEPSDRLSLHFDNYDSSGESGERVFDATLLLKREPMTARAMRSILWRFPLITVKVAWGIYWQALRLFLKGVPVFPHPRREQSKKRLKTE
jgi:hypothetical protein